MSKLPLSVGLDYHTNSIQVCILDHAGKTLLNRSCPSDAAAVAELVEPLGHPFRAAIEACTGAAELADELVLGRGWDLDLAHPAWVRRLRRDRDKTDASDARTLAELTHANFLPKVWLAPAETRRLRTLVRYRQQLADERRDAKLRILAVLREARIRTPAGLRRWSAGWLRWAGAVEGPAAFNRFVLDRHLRTLDRLEDEVAEVEREMQRATAHDPLVARLRSRPGIGLVTACVLRAVVGRFDRFHSGKQLAKYCGVTPCNASSGARQSDAGLIRAGSTLLKRTLVEAAHRLIRLDPRWAALARRLRSAGKPVCVVVAAVANRWIRALYHEMKQEEATAPSPIA